MANVKEMDGRGDYSQIGEVPPPNVPVQFCVNEPNLTSGTDLRELVESGRNPKLTNFVKGRLRKRFFVWLSSGVGQVIALVSRDKDSAYPGPTGIVFGPETAKPPKFKNQKKGK